MWRAVCACTAALLPLIAASPARAAPSAPPPTDQAAVLRAVAACRALPEAVARLACFDRAVAALEQAVASGEVAVVDREQQRKVRRQAFGLNLPSLDLFDRGEPKEETERLTATLASASFGPDGRLRFETTDGAAWRMSDAQSAARTPAKGAALTIRKGALGSFFCSVGTAEGRCERTR